MSELCVAYILREVDVAFEHYQSVISQKPENNEVGRQESVAYFCNSVRNFEIRSAGSHYYYTKDYYAKYQAVKKFHQVARWARGFAPRHEGRRACTWVQGHKGRRVQGREGTRTGGCKGGRA